MTDKELLELFNTYVSYDKETGIFKWIKSPNRKIKIGQNTGSSVNSDGYLHVQVCGNMIKAHRLAWLMCTGKMPAQIDHINGIRTDNRIVNLRSVTADINSQNQRNPHAHNSLGVLGVIKKPSGRYAADIRVKGKKIYLGTFDRIEDASNAYITAKRKFHIGSTL